MESTTQTANEAKQRHNSVDHKSSENRPSSYKGFNEKRDSDTDNLESTVGQIKREVGRFTDEASDQAQLLMKKVPQTIREYPMQTLLLGLGTGVLLGYAIQRVKKSTT